ncbi:MAG: class I SAM-dependent methyltransferase [Microscillaceae bacterium]|nr:class I SAM-dependent methyltransferase [Microscillaceae bacterium]MDW8460770.1 class I SAM-dependent methyltransferase [Cytophagales bacterium]
MLLAFFKHWFTAGNAHDIHSPFVYKLYTQVICSNDQYYAFFDLAELREEMRHCHDWVEVQDFGAGSKKNKQVRRRVSEIFHHSVSSERKSELLFRLVNYFQPNTILELGTCLGVNTLYLALAKRKAQCITLEGSPALAQIAQANFNRYGGQHIQIVLGNIDNTLLPTLNKISTTDFIFFDANHRFEPTMRYFEQCLRKKTEKSVFVFDDIYWSKEMQQAWQAIQRHEEVICTIDLFYVGLVFFNPQQAKQHFKLYWR